MTNIDKFPQSELGYERNQTSVPLALSRIAVNETGVFGYVATDLLSDHFAPTDAEDLPVELSCPSAVRSAE